MLHKSCENVKKGSSNYGMWVSGRACRLTSVTLCMCVELDMHAQVIPHFSSQTSSEPSKVTQFCLLLNQHVVSPLQDEKTSNDHEGFVHIWCTSVYLWCISLQLHHTEFHQISNPVEHHKFRYKINLEIFKS